MRDYTLTREEQETIIRASAADEEWDFWTIDPKFVRRLEKLGYRLQKDHQGGWSCKIPLADVRIRRVGVPRRKVSQETIAALIKSRSFRKSHDPTNGNSDQPAA